MDTLKPCPFCGGEARMMKQHRWWVSCQECICDLGFEGMDERGCYGHYDTEAEAVKAWNTRAPMRNIEAYVRLAVKEA